MGARGVSLQDKLKRLGIHHKALFYIYKNLYNINAIKVNIRNNTDAEF